MIATEKQTNPLETEMISFSTASQMASAYTKGISNLAASIAAIENEMEAMNRAFNPKNSWERFDIKFEYDLKKFKSNAWKMIISHLGIRKLMSSQRQKELDDALERDINKLPDISEENIMAVVGGYIGSAEDFLQEAIHEEYDYFRPHSSRPGQLKTNLKSLYKLDEKIIVAYGVEDRKWSSQFSVSYSKQSHFMSLDNIFHLLDGKGSIQGCNGPLVDAINSSGPAGIGETEYFEFKCFLNRNLHLRFKRKDLLDRFNAICGRNRLPAKS